jgi:hypothetical protein
MQHVPINDESLLESLSEEHTESSESFIIILEEQLESGELTLEDVQAILEDYMR